MIKHKRILVIGVKGAWSSEVLVQELEKLSQDKVKFCAKIVQISELIYLPTENKVLVEGEDICAFDAVIIKKLGKYSPKIIDWLDILSTQEDRGLRFFSSPKKLKEMISRIGCTRLLGANDIPLPNTLITEEVSKAIKWIDSQEAAVFKPNFSTKARGMEIFKKGKFSRRDLEKLKEEHRVLYLQKFMKLPGKDFGVVFSGGEYIGTYARVGSKDSWNTTTAEGGHYESFEPSTEILAIAKKSQAIFGLDFCCVDIAETENGPIVFEVSAFGGFKGMYKGAGVNAAEILAKNVVKSLS